MGRRAQEPRARLGWGRLWGSQGLYLWASPALLVGQAKGQACFAFLGRNAYPSPSRSAAALTGQRHLEVMISMGCRVSSDLTS